MGLFIKKAAILILQLFNKTYLLALYRKTFTTSTTAAGIRIIKMKTFAI